MEIERTRDEKNTKTMDEWQSLIDRRRQQISAKNTTHESVPKLAMKSQDSLIEKEHDVMKAQYIEQACRSISDKELFHESTIRIIKHCMYQDFQITKYLTADKSAKYVHTAYLLYRMFESHKFNDEDYYAAEKLKVQSAFEADVYFLELVKNKITAQ